MGYKLEIVTVTARISNHNSEQDETDQAAWERFARQVREMAERPEFEHLEIDVTGGES